MQLVLHATMSIEPKVLKLRTGLRALPLQTYVNGQREGGPSSQNFNVSRVGFYSPWSPGLGLGWWTNLQESAKLVRAQVTMYCVMQ